jgi:predicted DNA-binding transcriptional regulator YafY
MSARNTLKRLGLLIMILKRNHYPSKQELLDYYEQRDLGMSDRSFSRMLEHLRNEFDIQIAYHPAHRGYYIDWNKSMDLYAMEDLIELSQINQLIIEYLKNQAVHNDYIILDSRTEMEGMDVFVPLMKAIKECKEVRFNHFKYETEQMSEQLVQPYFLKEFERRWYLVGKRITDGKRRVYGLDRIHNFEQSTKGFTKDERFHIEDYKNTVGLKIVGEGVQTVQTVQTVQSAKSMQSVQTVRLQFTRFMGYYIESLPIHHTQILVEKTIGHMIFELKCHISYELFNLIMKYGAQVKVLAPDTLAQWVSDEHQKSFAQYVRE